MMKMKMTKRKALWMYAAVLVIGLAAVAAAQVPVVGSIIDAAIGYTVNHAAPSGQVLCGNGSVGTFASSCAANAGTATQLAATPAQCPVGQNATGIQANGTANCSPAPIKSDVTASRTFGSTYHNTGSTLLYVTGYGQVQGGSGDSQISCLMGPSSPSVTTWSMTDSFTVAGEPAGFVCLIPPGYYYEVAVQNHISSAPQQWNETPIP
jgi:hypothetical protein